MDLTDNTFVLLRYLNSAHDAVRWKTDGLSEYDLRRPLTPTGTSMLGVVKHLSWVELGYFGLVFDRPTGIDLPDTDDPFEDMYATADETVAEIFELFDKAHAQARGTIEELALDAQGNVPWWGDVNPVTVQTIAVHMIAEFQRHLGQLDILREGLDGATGYRKDGTNMPGKDEFDWPAYVDKVESIAAGFKE